MRKYCMKRLLTLFPTLFLMSIILFGLVKIMPGDPVAMMMDPHTKPELYAASYEAKKEELGFNDSAVIQYLHYVENILTGNYGYSSSYQAPVKEVIADPLANTIVLNGTVLFLSFFLSLCLGVFCAVKKHSLLDRIVQYISVAGISMPAFLLGAGLLYLFAFKLHWVPIGGRIPHSIMDTMINMFLPVATLTLLSFCHMVRYVRNAMIEALSADYILALRSRGVPKKRILFVHALRNALLPIMSVVLLEIPNLISGSILVEIIFSYNGIGSVMMKALFMRDGYLILTMNLLYAGLYIFTSFAMDIVSAYLDPRIRLDKHG